MSDTVWVMDSELCDECGWLLGYFGECTNPNCIAWEGWNEWDEDEEDDTWYGEDDEELEEAKKRVHDLFYQKLTERHPDSPWLKEKPDETHHHPAE